MKKIESFLSKNRVYVSLLMLILAVVTGGGALAVATVGGEGNAPMGGDEPGDPVNPESGTGKSPENDPTGRLAPGDKTAGQNLDGSAPSATQYRDGGLEEDEWDTEITKFQPWRSPLLALVRRITRTVNIANPTVKHARVGGETLDGRTTRQITAESDGTIKLTKSNFRGSLTSFLKGYTLMVNGVPGYAEEATTTNYEQMEDGDLMLFVLSNDGSTVVATAVNGIPIDDVQTETFDSMKCPTIPADTYICLGAAALSETEMELPPTNYQPRYERFYTQKKGFNILWSGVFDNQKKKIPFKVEDIKADALWKYNLGCERTYINGANRKVKKRNVLGQIEDCYFTKGISRQVTNQYCYERGKMKLWDLVALSKLQFTNFSQTNHAYAFCGKDFMEDLLNIEIKDAQKTIDFKDQKEFDIDFKRVKTTFGTLDFVYDPGLDACGYKDCCFILDLKGATRYVWSGIQKEQTNDLSKGHDALDAERYMRVEADGLALRGYNSIIVMPADRNVHFTPGQIMSSVIAMSQLPSDSLVTDGMIVALTDNVYAEDGSIKYKKGFAYQASKPSDTVTWSEWKGYTSVTM